MPQSTQSGGQPTPVQRALLNRQGQVRRSTSGSSSRAIRPHSKSSSVPSPGLQPTPVSKILPPSTTKSPIGAAKGGMLLPSVDMKAQQPQQPLPPLESRPYSQQQPSRLSIPTSRSSMQGTTPARQIQVAVVKWVVQLGPKRASIHLHFKLILSNSASCPAPSFPYIK